MTDGVQEWRSKRGEWKSGLILVVWGAVFASVSVVGLVDHFENVFPGIASIVTGATYTLLGATYCSRARIRIVLTAETLTVATVLRTRWFLVGQVEDGRVGRWVIEFTMKDGQKVRSALVAADCRSSAPKLHWGLAAKGRSNLGREIEGAVLTAAVRARAQSSGLILLPPGTKSAI